MFSGTSTIGGTSVVITSKFDAKTILSEASGYIGAYTHTLSPSRGCLHACSYCYVPMLYFHRRMAPSWGRQLAVKANAVELLRRDGASGKLANARIFYSPNTDPLQPSEANWRPNERQFHKILEVFCDHPPQLLVIQTRSPWID